MEKGDKGSTMTRMGVSGWMFLLVPAYPGCPGSKAVKRSLLFLPYASILVMGMSIWSSLKSRIDSFHQIGVIISSLVQSWFADSANIDSQLNLCSIAMQLLVLFSSLHFLRFVCGLYYCTVQEHTKLQLSKLQRPGFQNNFRFIIRWSTSVPSVLWRCWLGGRKGIRPVKKLE